MTPAVDIIQPSQPKLELKRVLYYAGHIIAAYENSPKVDVYKVNGPLVNTLQLQDCVSEEHLLTQVTHMMIPRLDWQDREFDT